MVVDFFGTAPFVVLSAVIGWGGALWTRRERTKKEKVEAADRLEIHRDDLTFDLLQAARGEVSVAYAEMKDLREEVRTLRALEKHFYHFQQALDHLEAILFAPSPEAKEAAERNAKAFLNRMRRLNEAKGTIRNEVQTVASEIHVAEGKIPKEDE